MVGEGAAAGAGGAPRPAWARRLLGVALGSLVGLGLGELVVRIVLPPPQSVVLLPAPGLEARLAAERAEKRQVDLAGHPEEGGLYVATGTGRRLRASTRVLIRNHRLSGQPIEITTNSLGFRNRELGPRAGTRVLFLGDSITFSDFLPEPDTFVRLVETGARARGLRIETVNAGVGGVSLAEELALLVETGLRTEPDAVVLDFFLNDHQPSAGVHVPVLPRLLRRSRLVEQAAASFSVWNAGRLGFRYLPTLDALEEDGAGEGGSGEAAFREAARRSRGDWGGAWSTRSWRRLEPLLAELDRLSREHGFALYFVCFPARPQVEAREVHDYPQRRLAAIAGRLGVPVLDLLPVLREAHRESAEPLYFDHCHQTLRGSRLVAREILAFLERELPKRVGSTSGAGRAAGIR